MRLMFEMDLELDKLRKSIKQVNKNTITKAGQATFDFFLQEYKNAIVHFYRDYFPKRYDRVFNFYDNSYDLQIKTSGAIMSEILFEASPQKMYGGYADKKGNILSNNLVDFIFESVMWGYHGSPEVHTTIPSFYTVIDNMAANLNIDGILNSVITTELERV